jgi:hypothetical protein
VSDPDIGDTDRPTNGVGPLIEPPVPLAEEVDTKSIRIPVKPKVPDPVLAVDVRRDEPLMPTKKDMKRRPKQVTEEEE